MPAADTRSRVDQLAAWRDDVTVARYVDTSRRELLGGLGIETVGDLVSHYPFRYIDLTTTRTLAEVRPGDEVTVVGRVHDVKLKNVRPRLTIVEVALVDGTGIVLGVWFNQPYMAGRFVKDERVAFAGPVALEYGMKQMRNPYVEKLGAGDGSEASARVIPVHRTTEGLTVNWMRRLVAAAVDDFADVPDFIPVRLRVDRSLVSRSTALREIHFPASMDSAHTARRRLAYEELLCVQVGMALRRHHLTRDLPGVAHAVDGPLVSGLRAALPFDPTADQERALVEILADMGAPRPMNRMLLGDVGTGKTLVGAFALCAAVDSGHQAAMMAPTEVLAAQYAEKVGPWLDGLGIEWALVTGSCTPARRREIDERLADGRCMVAFGTHALLEATFADLTLAIVDEQHRFGVGQRLGLRAKGAAVDLLVMTATPIPRSLALTLYGDLDTSYLRLRPTADGRHRITTELVSRSERGEAYQAVRDAVAAGHQAYVVCPLVDESDSAQATAAVAEADRLTREVFSDLSVGLLTGRMKPAEKSAVMTRFREGAVDVLVATTVIEVGVDVPNATVMIVEDAERFGLAQLHQLRGRIGRGGHDSRFLLFADPNTPEGGARMESIVSISDGFELAEADLALRGEGQVLGLKQHGLPELRLASVTTDRDLLDLAREDARGLVEADPQLEDPVHVPLREEVRVRFGRAWEWVSSG